MSSAGSVMVERVGGRGNAAAARWWQRGAAVVGAGQRQCGGGVGGGSVPAASGLVAVVAVLWHCGVSFKNSATFMASDQKPSGGHAQHVTPLSDARLLSLACWEANSMVLQQVLIVQ
jgi:hypothetical protein